MLATDKQDKHFHQMSAQSIGLLNQPEHEAIAEIWAYWHSKCQDGQIPARSDIHPRELVRHMPYIMLADSFNNGADFRIRLMGTSLIEMIGEDRTGKTLREFGGAGASPEAQAIIRGRWLVMTQRAVQTRAPALLKARMQASKNALLTAHSIIAPLRGDGHEVTQLIGAMYAVRDAYDV
ncbi:MAG: PAS domain-containing protein [Rhizobiales bacterium]|nr:PAS domain-containing protein [Hyphomicrobiales bacterium]